jgi:ATP-dependent RNA helicase RhlB
VEILVLDEADRMLDMGFLPDVRQIVRATPFKEKRQTLLFSATFPDEIRRAAEGWTTDPIKVSIEPEQIASQSVEQLVYITTNDQKYHLLYNLITQQKLQRVLIFANRRDETRFLTERLRRDHIQCSMLSGDVAQDKRIKTLEAFRNGKIRVLVATDVAGRGLHIDGISHVINFTLPDDPEDYVHRIGRTGRAGALGTSISFATEDDAFNIPAIETLIGQKLHCLQPDESLLKEKVVSKPIVKETPKVVQEASKEVSKESSNESPKEEEIIEHRFVLSDEEHGFVEETPPKSAKKPHQGLRRPPFRRRRRPRDDNSSPPSS